MKYARKMTEARIGVPTEISPLLQSRDHYPFSSAKHTYGNIVIAIVGAGVLGLPCTFKQAGWLSGSIVLILIALACFHTMMLLVKCKRKLESDSSKEVRTYSDLGFLTFGYGGEMAVDCLVLLSQAGFCAAYLIFIGENLASVFTGLESSHFRYPYLLSTSDGGSTTFEKVIAAPVVPGLDWSGKEIYIWIGLPLQILLACIRSLTRLAPFSILADIANVVAMGVVMRYDVVSIVSGYANVEAFNGLKYIPYVTGVAIYAFEGFSLVIPLESSMKDRSKFGSVLGWAMASVTALYTLFAVLGYFAYGELTKDIVTLNLEKSWQTVTIKVALCFGLFFTFPVMMHPVHEIIERRFKIGRSSLVSRSFVLVMTTLLAVSVPHFGVFLSLVGSSVCCILSFVLPALFHLRVFSAEVTKASTFWDCLSITFGVAFGIWGTIVSVSNMLVSPTL